jgi:multiple sugar transport system ATP-binding protein
MSTLTLQSVSKTYPGGVVGLKPFSLTLPLGERLVLLGPSGSGKSTLLRLIAGLEEPDSGEIHWDDRRIDQLPPHKRGVGLLPQKPALYPHLTVEENLNLGLGAVPSQFAVETLELSHLLSRKPDQLSGGEKQRVALARLLIRQSRLWLLDEPFSALDPVFRSEFRQVLHLLLDQTGATMILVTHDPADVGVLGQRIGVMDQGELQQIGTVEELRALPETQFVAFCLRSWNLIHGHLAVHASGGDSSKRHFVSEDGLVSIPVPKRLGSKLPHNLTLGIRLVDVSWHSSDGAPELSLGVLCPAWQLVSAEPVGSGWLLTLRRGKSSVRVAWPSDSPPPFGASADLYLPPEKCLWFDGQTGRRIDFLTDEK